MKHLLFLILIILPLSASAFTSPDGSWSGTINQDGTITYINPTEQDLEQRLMMGLDEAYGALINTGTYTDPAWGDASGVITMPIAPDNTSCETPGCYPRRPQAKFLLIGTADCEGYENGTPVNGGTCVLVSTYTTAFGNLRYSDLSGASLTSAVKTAFSETGTTLVQYFLIVIASLIGISLAFLFLWNITKKGKTAVLGSGRQYGLSTKSGLGYKIMANDPDYYPNPLRKK